MAKKHQLRKLRAGTVINATSKKQEHDIIKALKIVEDSLSSRFKGVSLNYLGRWYLKDIINPLSKTYSNVDFHCHFETSYMCPDGGILFITDKKGNNFPILISEVKNQGTNDIRAKEGLKKQAKGNAIERLGKNVIGLRTALLSESIFPFICFGYGCDFAEDSTILDRVSTIAMFGQLNKTYLHQQGQNGEFCRGSFYFHQEKWSVKEMVEVMLDISERSIQYYFSKYAENNFI